MACACKVDSSADAFGRGRSLGRCDLCLRLGQETLLANIT
jgi:hypothetical protein